MKIRSTPLKIIGSIVGLFVVLVLVKLWLFPSHPPLAMETARVTRGDMSVTVEATGEVSERNLVSVGAQVSGQLKKLYVTLGQKVKKGDLIAQIDSTTQENALHSAEAALDSMRAALHSARATETLDELAFKRQQVMLSHNVSSQEDYDTAKANLAIASANVAADLAQIRGAEISVDTAKVNLGYTKIVAPSDGEIVAIVATAGQTLNANQSTPTIVKLGRMDKVTVEADISEADVTKVKPGMKAYFTILGEPDRRYETTLRSIDPAPESLSSSSSTNSSSSSSGSSSSAIYYDGLLDVANPDGTLRIDMTTEVTIVLAEVKNALTIPITALGPKAADGSSTVMVVDGEGRPRPRRVTTGLNNGVNVQVLSGLREGEEVVTSQASAPGSSDSSSLMRRPPPPPAM